MPFPSLSLSVPSLFFSFSLFFSLHSHLLIFLFLASCSVTSISSSSPASIFLFPSPILLFFSSSVTSFAFPAHFCASAMEPSGSEVLDRWHDLIKCLVFL
jgi:hypothetical protein